MDVDQAVGLHLVGGPFVGPCQRRRAGQTRPNDVAQVGQVGHDLRAVDHVGTVELEGRGPARIDAPRSACRSVRLRRHAKLTGPCVAGRAHQVVVAVVQLDHERNDAGARRRAIECINVCLQSQPEIRGGLRAGAFEIAAIDDVYVLVRGLCARTCSQSARRGHEREPGGK